MHCSTLVEIQQNDEPMWIYFDAQHKHVLEQMRKTYSKAVTHIEGEPSYGIPTMALLEMGLNCLDALRKNINPLDNDQDVHTMQVALELQSAVYAIEHKQADIIIAKTADERAWQAIVEMVKGISDVMLSMLPNFWRIAKGFVDGKFKKVNLSDSLFH